MRAAGQRIIRVKTLKREQRVWMLGDMHLMNRGCDERLVDATIQRIADDSDARWVGMGDYLDLISLGDKRFDPNTIAEKSRSAYFAHLGKSGIAMLKEKFAPIAGQCLGLAQGNHEWKYANTFDEAIIEDVCEALSIPYLAYSSFFDIIYVCGKKHETFRMFIHHGAGSAATKGGKLNRLERFMLWFDADLYAVGHMHAKLDDEVSVLCADEKCEKIIDRAKFGVISGTFLRTYTQDDVSTGYGERAGYQPTPLGAPCFVIDPLTRDIGIEKKRPRKLVK